MLSSNLLKSKIPILGGGCFTEFDAEFKFAKIQNSHFVGEGGFVEFDAEFKFAKIQNSHIVCVCVGGGRGGLWNLMLSSNLLKSKIPILCVGGGGFVEFDAEFKFAKIQSSQFGWGGGWWNQISTFDAESKFAKKKKIFFAKNFLSFRAKMCLGMVFDSEYQVVRLYRSICEPQKLLFHLN